MSSSTFTINGVECRVSGDEIDLRVAGFLKTSIPPELLNNHQIKILLCHDDVPEFLESIVDNLGPDVSIKVFADGNNDDDYDDGGDDDCDENKSCEIVTDELGFIGLDVRCNALNVVRLITACKRKLRRLVLRNYECGALDELDRTTVSDVEELASNSPLKDLIKLDMTIFGLKKVPDALQNCIHLDDLSLSNNSELGQQPFSISSLKNLKILHMNNCRLKKVPDGLENCINLEDLRLSDNSELGQQSFSISSLKNLKILHMNNCGLKKVPDGLENCINLEDLSLSDNRELCGMENVPDDLENCIDSEDLSLWGNSKLGQQSFSISSLKNLKKLHMNNCDLNNVPDGLENCINLEELSLWGNSELGQQSFSIPSLKNLKKLCIDYCGVEKVPDGLKNCINLEDLSLSGNSELDQQSFSISSLKNLKKLHVNNCGLKNVRHLNNCINLEDLSLSDNSELGQYSFSIPSLKNLKKLHMNFCGLKKVPGGLEKCINLEDLSLFNNSELGQQSFSISSLKNLKILNMNNCGLKKVPHGLENCINLEDLTLSDNSELGQQSFSLSSLKNFKKLHLDYCGLKKVPENTSASTSTASGAKKRSHPEGKTIREKTTYPKEDFCQVVENVTLEVFAESVSHPAKFHVEKLEVLPFLEMLKNWNNAMVLDCVAVGLQPSPMALTKAASLTVEFDFSFDKYEHSVVVFHQTKSNGLKTWIDVTDATHSQITEKGKFLINVRLYQFSNIFVSVWSYIQEAIKKKFLCLLNGSIYVRAVAMFHPSEKRVVVVLGEGIDACKKECEIQKKNGYKEGDTSIERFLNKETRVHVQLRPAETTLRDIGHDFEQLINRVYAWQHTLHMANAVVNEVILTLVESRGQRNWQTLFRHPANQPRSLMPRDTIASAAKKRWHLEDETTMEKTKKMRQNVTTCEGSGASTSRATTEADAFDSNREINTNVSINELRSLVRQRLCRKLDLEHELGNDYRTLAAHFGMTNDQIELISQMKSGTQRVLKWAEQKSENTVGKLIEILREMERDDCVKIVNEI